jgi:hypothetical protein
MWYAGVRQKKGIDYAETFAFIVKPMSYKALFAIATALDLEIHQMDVKTAFLYENIDTEIFVDLPEGTECGSDQICYLNKALYGLKQSLRIWYNTLLEFLKTQGFEPLTSDLGIFSKSHTYIAIYVDNLLIAGPNIGAITELKNALSKRFKMSDLEESRYYLGMEIIGSHPQRTLRLSQKSYVTKILSDFDMQECKSTQHP